MTNQKEKSLKKNGSNNSKKDTVQKDKPLKYGSMPTFPRQRIFTRAVIIFSTLIVVYFSSNKNKEVQFAPVKEDIPQRVQNFDCAPSYSSEMEKYPGCMPERCGRVVTDRLISRREADVLLTVARNGLALGGSAGGASILDLHSGALSKGTKFINIYSLEASKKIFTPTEFAVYRTVRSKIQHAIAHHFGTDMNKIHLTHPTFFSRMTNGEAKTIHDEYWHVHVDKETYASFHYTSLLYLTDFGTEFQGGRFVFTGAMNSTVEPKKGRVLMFTSGAENPHFVERVTSGTRFALTVSFTCNEKLAIADPSFQ